MEHYLKCYEESQDCFACYDGQCRLLKSYHRDGKRIRGTRKGEPCSFYKTAEEAGGTYEQLVEKYREY